MAQADSILAYEVSAQDDDSNMLGDDTYIPTSDRYRFHDWRFGRDGIPHLATCETCGQKTKVDFLDPSFRAKKRRRDATATYDGYLLVSSRFVETGLAYGGRHEDIARLPGDESFYWLNPPRLLEFGAETSGRCPECKSFYNVIGPQPVFAIDLQEPLALGFYRSDLEFGSGPEQGPVIIAGVRTAQGLRDAKLAGVELSPIRAGEVL